MFALGMPAMLMFAATTFFLEGIGRSTPGMAVMAIANLVNFGLNYALMFEPWQMGAAGAALATSITRWFMFLALAGYVLAMRGRDHYGVAAPMAGHWSLERKLAPAGLADRRVLRPRARARSSPPPPSPAGSAPCRSPPTRSCSTPWG